MEAQHFDDLLTKTRSIVLTLVGQMEHFRVFLFSNNIYSVQYLELTVISLYKLQLCEVFIQSIQLLVL